MSLIDVAIPLFFALILLLSPSFPFGPKPLDPSDIAHWALSSLRSRHRMWHIATHPTWGATLFTLSDHP